MTETKPRLISSQLAVILEVGDVGFVSLSRSESLRPERPRAVCRHLDRRDGPVLLGERVGGQSLPRRRVVGRVVHQVDSDRASTEFAVRDLDGQLVGRVPVGREG